jgi:hypothetical protein
MHECNPIIGAAGRTASIRLAAIILFLTALPCSALAAQHAGPSTASAAGKTVATSPKVHELLTLLATEWLEEQGVTKSAAPPAQEIGNSVEEYLNSGAGAIHDQIVALAGAIPDLPTQFERAAARVTALDGKSGRAKDLLNLTIFGAFGFGAQWLFRKMTGRVRRHLDVLPMNTVNDRLRVISVRFALGFGAIGAFTLGSVGPVLALDWDPIRRGMVLGFLIALVVIRVAVATEDLLAVLSNRRLRVPTLNIESLNQ